MVKKPKVGSSNKELGVRIPGDIASEAGLVRPGCGGMSVAPSWRQPPIYKIPRRLRHLRPGAAGSNSLSCWTFGAGEFANGQFAASLILAVSSQTHGCVEPERQMPVSDYTQAITNTRDRWVIEES